MSAQNDAISAAEADLARLDRERAQAQWRLAQLRTGIAAVPPQCDNGSAERVSLFRSLFRGRDDVYATRWVSATTGKSGYAPAYTPEWRRRLWDEPALRRAPRPPHVLLPLTDDAIRAHLRGDMVLGVYPLLPDETCRFLAVDFDGKREPTPATSSRPSNAEATDWTADVRAFVETCTAHHLPIAVERSRSGNGAHVWFFFTEPIAASVARTMGSFLLTESMERRPALSFASYDRLFPNQDTMPKGGFGNLIALPLQGAAIRNGNSVFLDEHGTPFADQWRFLAEIQRIAPEVVERIADDARAKGRIVGVPMSETDDTAPWERPPSRSPKLLTITGPLPSSVTIVRAQQIFIPKDGLPPQMLTALKRLASFQNPSFYALQKMRLSVAKTPRVIACAEDSATHLALPRGCEDEARALLTAHGIVVTCDDRTTEGMGLDVSFHGTLTPLQRKAKKAILAHDTGVFVAPPGSGKTVVGAACIAARGRSTLVLVHRTPLLEQWVAQLSLFLGIERSAIGIIGGGKDTPNGTLDVAMLQTLVRRGVVQDRIAQYGHIVIDECHHLPAFSFERVLAEAKAKYVLGLTATPQRRDGHHPIITMQCGPIRFAVGKSEQRKMRPFTHRLIVRETKSVLSSTDEDTRVPIHALYDALGKDDVRTELIVHDVRAALAEGRTPIVLTERRDHLERLATLIVPLTPHCIVLKGGGTEKQRRIVMDALTTIPKDEPMIILATGKYIGEGFDDARLDTLFLALPVSWRGTLVQYAGRLHRLHPDKHEVRVYDYVDRQIPTCVRMFEKRKRGYRALEYEEAIPHE